ncbi:hypothetical protein Tco_0654075 [Tanacetum coccineum]|uniref:DNA-directed DNA polymerase n=1 Tax=Tanacetum coccineum TaxID=301880 RepID=A0ABQ4X278_9ASTR
MIKPDHQDPNALDNMKSWKRYCFHKFIMNSYYGKVATEMRSLEIDDMLRIKLCEAESNEEIFTSVAWIGALNIKEPIYSELFHEFYSTYEFDEVCADDELQTKKIIKFRLCGRAHSLTLLEFARRLGFYHAEELDEDGFDVYFQGGLRNDDHFNAQEYWLSISQEENLSLSRSQASTIRSLILRVIYKMITYGLCQRTTGYDKIQKNDLWLLSMFDARHQNRYTNVAWLIARGIKKKGAGTQRESQICCGQFITKLARKSRVLSDEVIRSLSALIYYRDLDTITLRELIDSKGRLIPEDPQPSVPSVAIPRHPRASMQDLYDRMGSMEIRREAIERMEYRQSYHWDRYAGVFEAWLGFTVFHCREHITHLVMLNRSMINIISSTHPSHQSIRRSISSSSSMMMMSSVEMTQVNGLSHVRFRPFSALNRMRIFYTAQQIIPAAQLVPKFQSIRRCNNYAMLQSIPCSPECKIVGQILLDHLLSYALTATNLMFHSVLTTILEDS